MEVEEFNEEDDVVEDVDDINTNAALVEEDRGTPHKHDSKFKGPIEDRSCTDVICALLFLACILLNLLLSLLAFAWGNPNRLLYPHDFNGDQCGIGKHKDRPYLFFFDLAACARVGPGLMTRCPTPQVCVAECPTETIKFSWFTNQESRAKMICRYHIDPLSSGDMQTLIEQKQCASYYLASTPVLSRCVPKLIGQSIKAIQNAGVLEGEGVTMDALNKAIKYIGQFFRFRDIAELVIKDIKTSYSYIIFGLMGALIISLVWIVLLRWVAGYMVWVAILFFVGLLALISAQGYSKYYDLKNNRNSTFKEVTFPFEFEHYVDPKDAWLFLGCTSATILSIVLLIIIFIYHRLRIAIVMIKEASRAIGFVSCALMWPFFPFLLHIIVILYTAISLVYISTMGESKYAKNDTSLSSDVQKYLTHIPCKPHDKDLEGQVCKFMKFSPAGYTPYFQAFSVFMFLWLMNFIIALGQMTLSGVFASYYWAWNKTKDIPESPILASLYRTLRYHIGTLAFGSLIIAIVQFIRGIIAYIYMKLKDTQNDAAKFMLKCMACCFWCVEKFLKFVNKNAFIMTAIYGYNFCTAAIDSFQLVVRNAVRLLVLDKVAEFIIALSKIIITGTVAVISYYIFAGGLVPEITYIFVPISFITLGAYLISNSFFNIYNMAIDTLFLCVLEDVERNDGSPGKPYFMRSDIKEVLNLQQKAPVSVPSTKPEMQRRAPPKESHGHKKIKPLEIPNDNLDPAKHRKKSII